MLRRDFTFAKYLELCRRILDSNYILLTMEQYFTLRNKPNRFIIIRHDVDYGNDLSYTLKMARKEAELGITATYYFRTHDDVFKPDIIREIADLGHEIGYHYDVLGEAEGDYDKAIMLFEKELAKLRRIYDVKTISMHGGPLIKGMNAATISGMLHILGNVIRMRKVFVPWASKDLWKKYDFRKYGIIGDAYLSINFNDVAYISDTNRSWSNTKHRLNDYVDGNTNVYIRNTDDLIRTIEREDIQRMVILTHPPNWRDEFRDWLKWLVIQKIRNAGKACLKTYWKLDGSQ